jgi:hypothetical protein
VTRVPHDLEVLGDADRIVQVRLGLKQSNHCIPYTSCCSGMASIRVVPHDLEVLGDGGRLGRWEGRAEVRQHGNQHVTM